MRGVLLSLVLATCVASAARGDIIDLRDGRHLSGTISRQGDVMSIRLDNGSVVVAKPEDVIRVTLTGTISPADAAAAEWTRISAQVKVADDLQTVLSLHQKYLEQYPDAANAMEVRASLSAYQKLATSHAVKFRGRWVAQAQIEVILHDWADAAKPAVAFYKAGRFKEALEAVKGALDADKENPDALSVAGLAAYRMNNLPLARTNFTALAASDPGNVLAENNLAVVSFAQKQVGEGIYHYGKALQIAPDNRLVLDNIVEAMAAYLAVGDKNAETFKALQRQFDAAEKKMEERLAAKGLVRRGSTWVDKQTADKLAVDQQTLQGQLAQMSNQYGAAQDSLARLDGLMKQADDDYNAALVAISIDNAAISSPEPRGPRVFDIFAARDLAVQNANRAAALKSQYQAQRDQIAGSSRDLFAQADRLKAALDATQVRLSGTQRIMEMGEGENPPPPATLPAAI